MNHFDLQEAGVRSYEIAGPGFITMRFHQAAKFSVIADVLRQGAAFGSSKAFEGKSVLLEYVSANPTGPLHLGHARQGALGDVLARVMHTQGYKVMREFYYNDAGVQIHNLTLSVQARAKQELGLQGAEAFPEKGYQGLYIYDIARESSPRMWRCFLRLRLQHRRDRVFSAHVEMFS